MRNNVEPGARISPKARFEWKLGTFSNFLLGMILRIRSRTTLLYHMRNVMTPYIPCITRKKIKMLLPLSRNILASSGSFHVRIPITRISIG